MASDRVQALAIVPLRVVVGVGFIVHGYAKWSRGPQNFAKLLQQLHVPFPLLSAWMVTALELVGGVAILVGVGLLLFSIPLIASMLVAMFQLQVRYGFSSVNTIGLTPNGPLFGPPGYEINLLYVAALITLAALGPGALSLDELRRRAR